uniref:Uncharacterized protein n=1 Tax=viral metagenome TaxID=1070528 RepID=A0A6H1ZZM2_9ZZZZ
MGTKYYATINQGQIIDLVDSSNEVELNQNQIPLTSNEIAILRIVHGDIQYAKNIIRDIEQRVVGLAG